MSRRDRRNILKMLTAAAVVPAFAPPVAAASGSISLISPPPGAMRFQRSVIRGLVGGAQIAVTREFSISFLRFADGFIVDGRQVSVDVSAPENLSAFAALERARVETAMFPITLDPFGQIISEEPVAERAGEVQAAFDEALQQIRRQPLTFGEHAELQQFIGALHQAGASLTVAMPTDLFAPADGERSENRTVTLPTGDVGLVTSRFGSERDPHSGLLRRALREVSTEVDGDRRETVERWQLGQN